MSLGQNTPPNLSQSGFAAISPKPPVGKMARRKVVRMPDGSVSTVFIDNETGQELPNTTGYNIIESSNYLDLDTLGLNPLSENQETTSAEVKKNILPKKQGETESNFRAGKDVGQGGGFASRGNPLENFGYINKPDWMKFTTAAPGMLGMIGKAANLGVNANNTAAVSEARKMIGLPEQTLGEKVKGTIKDQKGQVADVKIRDNQYSVGFEALSPSGRTNLTPQEARTRGLTQGGIELATRQEQKSADREFLNDFPERDRSGLSRFFDGIKSAADKIFGGSETMERVLGTSPRESSGNNVFPEAPKAQPNNFQKEYNRDRQGGFGGSLSPQADRAISEGRGGLY